MKTKTGGVTGTTKYPTKEQILKNLPRCPNKVLDLIEDEWSYEYKISWKRKTNAEKHHGIMSLISIVCAGLSVPIKEWPKYVLVSSKHGWAWGIHERQGTIFAPINNPSVISALHELSHHLNGESELKACRFSTMIFKAAFPGWYKRLVWKGHRLVRADGRHELDSDPDGSEYGDDKNSEEGTCTECGEPYEECYCGDGYQEQE